MWEPHNLIHLYHFQMRFYFVASNISDIWKPPSSWTAGDEPCVYRSFDDAVNLELFNGAKIVGEEVKQSLLNTSPGQIHEFDFVFIVRFLHIVV